MATHNPKESRATCESTLNYMYRGDNHEHSIGQIIHLGGNLLSPNPIKQTELGLIIDLDSIVAELNVQASRHTGAGEKLFKHYVISLAPSESLDACQWLEFISSYMQALGFDDSTKWTAVEHRETTANHVHILACRVRGDRSGTLVSTYKDYETGWPVMREYERKFGLQLVENPDEGFGKNKSKAYLKKLVKAPELEDPNHVDTDQAVLIRQAFKKLYETGKPRTMKNLVVGLAKLGVDVKLSFENSGEIKGINYRLMREGGRWISGSHVKATRFTWRNLQLKEGINYEPERDNPFLMKVDGTIEVHIRLNGIQEFYFLKCQNLKVENERRLLIARFRVQQSDNAALLLELVAAIIRIICGLLGIPLTVDDCDFTFVPNREPTIDKTPIRHGSDELVLEEDLASEMLHERECWINPKVCFDHEIGGVEKQSSHQVNSYNHTNG